MTEVPSANAAPAAYYAIEAPGVLRSNVNYNVAVNILEAAEPTTVKVLLSGESLKEEKTVQLPPMSTQLLTFEIPDLNPHAKYFLIAEGTGGIEFKEKIQLKCELSKPIVNIQLDKQAYKCNDKMDYRIILLDGNTRPAHVKAHLKISIKDENDIVTEFSNIELTSGVYTGEWLVPAAIAAGTYLFVVYSDSEIIATKEFQLIEYVPPKFEVIIKTAREVPYEQGQFNIVVQARNFDGVAVKGLCTLHLDAVGGYFGTGARPIDKIVNIDGSTDNFIFDFLDDLHIEPDFLNLEYFTHVSFKLQVTVHEEGTQREEQIEQLLIIKKATYYDDIPGFVCGRGSCGDCDVHELHLTEMPISIERQSQLIPIFKVGDEMEFEVKFGHELTTNYFIYTFIARGNIVRSELVHVKDHSKPYNVSVKATIDFVPRAFLLVYFIKNGQLYFDEMGFNLCHEFENQLELVAPTSATVSDVIQFEVKSSPHSFVGLMAVDKKSVIVESTNALNYEKVFRDLHYMRSETPWLDGSGEYPGLKAGLVTFTNATWEGFFKGDPDGTSQQFVDHEHMRFTYPNRCVDVDHKKTMLQRRLQERYQVYGNWFFINLETDDLGNLKFEKQLPSNPTTWLVTAFALNAQTGWVLMKEPLKIEAKPSTSSSDAELFNTTRTTSEVIKFEVHHYEDGEFRENIALKTTNTKQPAAVEFTLTTNLLGLTLANLATYAGIMYCTGHLHMTTLIPNVVVLEYLESLQQLESELALSIKSRLPEAIARELTERRADGAFVWFSHDESGSPHVTTLVLQAFQRAAKYVQINEDIISKGLAYLASLQTAAGDFSQEVEPYKQPFQADNNVGLTALVLLAFLRNENVTKKYKQLIDKSLDYIVQHAEEVKAVYDLAITFYALQLAKHSSAKQIKERLFGLACRDKTNNLIWWSYAGDSNDCDRIQPVYNVEVTAYVLLALLETEPLETLLPIVKYLLPWGKHFGDTNANESMDCALGLDAVLKFALKSHAPHGITRIGYTAFTGSEHSQGEIVLTTENCTNIITHLLPKQTQAVEFWTNDKGSFIGNVTCRYKKE